MASHPSGTVTFLFTDVEASTQRWERNPEAMAAALARHDALMREAIEARGGYVFKAIGDAFCAAFASAPDAAVAALHIQRALLEEDFSGVGGMPVRVALHAGHAEEREGDYFGLTLNRVARLLAVGHGGQVLVSGTAADLLQDAIPEESALRDLGLHRLRDLARAERVYQLTGSGLRAEFPALRSLEQTPNNLPSQLTSFVGREAELREIARLLREHRLVTLAGTAGAGKTRCAIHAGADLLERFGDGVWFVELAPIADAALVVAAIAQTLGVKETPSRPLLDALLAHLEGRRVLLILDNCEHVVAEVRRVAAATLRSCAEVRILATSRESLNIAGERAVGITSLPLPPADDAMALFADRAVAADGAFALTEETAALVGEIVTRLDGIPLAIELAAARIKVLSPPQLLDRLNERFRLLTGGDRSALPRQQTLRAAIDWSFDLLDERERTLFRRLSVFAGGWTLPAALAVCGERDFDEWEMLDALSSLVDKSLVIADPGAPERRYRMLTSIRDYASEHLAAAKETDEIAAAHARFYAGVVGGAQALVGELEDVRWRQLLGAELDNIRAAIERTIFAGREPEVGLGLLSELEWAELLTTPHEALRWFERAAALVDSMPSELAHARILRHALVLSRLCGRTPAESEPTAQRALEVAKGARDADEIARALANLGGTYRDSARFGEAESAFLEAYAAPESLSRLTKNVVLRIWAVTDLQRGDLELARGRFSQVAELERPGSEAHASALLNLGELHFAAGDARAAREAARRAKDTYAALGSVYLVVALSNLAAYAMALDDLASARADLRDALALERRARSGWFGIVLEHHALLAALSGKRESAALLAGFTDFRYTSRGEVRQRTEKFGRDRLSQILQAAYPAEELASKMDAGARLEEGEALEHAAAIHHDTVGAAALPQKE
ncbi:MAG: adenylate/guanylate cyclase domain-containing protein [Candidatus Eremiobacteraeota bacterium]|nr:adenylate/guanylate cyclase domain-containing protein [Candidatus Eremiobacteraeota bacterium]MBV8499030.1 adenylate/guanylate cyclase domain-containing protein [Candidatus Eremiobacteraeota bacterium]